MNTEESYTVPMIWNVRRPPPEATPGGRSRDLDHADGMIWASDWVVDRKDSSSAKGIQGGGSIRAGTRRLQGGWYARFAAHPILDPTAMLTLE